MKGPTSYITLTSLEPWGHHDGVIPMSERMHVWGNPFGITDVHPEASMIPVHPVVPVTREDDVLGAGAILTASRPDSATVVNLAHIVTITPGPMIEQATS